MASDDHPPCRVFLVEDNLLLQQELTTTLEELAPVTVVGTATGSSEACAWMDAREQACDVAIVDLFLASGSGIDVLRHMAKYAHPPQRFVLTNYASPDVHKQCLALGASAVFDKSTQLEDLLWTLEAVARGSELELPRSR